MSPGGVADCDDKLTMLIRWRRKLKTEAFLRKQRIPFLPTLPCIESERKTKLRSAEEVGVRIACLFCVVGHAFEYPDKVFKEYLKTHGLWDRLSRDELAFLTAKRPKRQAIVNLTWRSEALFVLMWAARLIDELPLPRHQTETGEIVSHFPPVDQSPWPFIRRLKLRKKSEILDASDLIYRMHWATTQAGLDDKPIPAGLNPEVIQEWHHAINWLTHYDDQEWDDVATDS